MGNTINIAAQNAAPSTGVAKKECKFCGKQGLLFQPLLYAVAPADAGAPALPGNCGDCVSGVSLTTSVYTLRTIRSGYLYVLIQRNGKLAWQSYAANAQGYLAEFPPLNPPLVPPEFSCEPNSCGVNASMVAIHQAEDVQTAWWLFSPAPVTPARLGQLTGAAVADDLCAKGEMVKFSPAAWLQGSYAQPNCLTEAQLPKAVVEYAMYEQGPKMFRSTLGKAMFNSAFPPMVPNADENRDGQPLAALHLTRMGSLRSAMAQAKGGAIAVPDPIGIVQSLNDFRNDALSAIENLHLVVDPKTQASHRDRFAVLQNLKDVQYNFEQGAIRAGASTREREVAAARAKYEPMFDDDSRMVASRKALASRPRYFDGRAKWEAANPGEVAKVRAEIGAIDAKHTPEAEQARAKKQWAEKYAPLLDQDAMTKFEALYTDAADKAMTLAGQRSDDFLKWLRGARLLDAFNALFDKNDRPSGWQFQYQASMCMIGMDGVPKCADHLDTWIQAAKIEESNLFLRSVMMNQSVLQGLANEALAAATQAAAGLKSPALLDGERMYKAFKGFASAMKATDSAWDEYARNQTKEYVKNYKKAFDAKALFAISQMTRSVSRAGISKGEVAVMARVGGLMYGMVLGTAEKLRFNELMYRVDPASPFNPKDKSNVEARSRDAAQKNATGMSAEQAREQSKAEVDAAKRDSARQLTQDAEEKQRSKVKLTMEESLERVRKDTKGETNNYHQVRIGVLMAGIEAAALYFKLKEMHDKGLGLATEEGARASASAAMLVSMSLDATYAYIKAMREKEAVTSVSAGGDVVRGGFKFAAGFLALGAGLVGVWFEGRALWGQIAGQRRPGSLVMGTLKTGAAFGTTLYGARAAFSYAGPILETIAVRRAEGTMINRAAAWWAVKAAAIAERVWLLRILAWANWVGFAVTFVDFGISTYSNYIEMKELGFTAWCRRSMFAKLPGDPNAFRTAQDELAGLKKAIELTPEVQG